MDQLVQKLKGQERVIEALFIVHPQSSVLLKQKLTTLQEEISQIPTNFGSQLYTEWSNKIAALWQQFVNELTERTSSKFPIPRTKSIFDRDHIFEAPCYLQNCPFAPVPQSDSFKDDISILNHLTNDLIIASPPPSYSEYFLNKILYNDSTNSKSKDNARREILSEFEQFTPVASSADNEAMERLRLLVAKARNKTIPFWYDYHLQAEIFDRALSKLPDTSRQLYIQLYDRQCRKRSLKDLLQFLCDESVGHYYNRVDYLAVERKHIAIRDEMKSLFERLTGQLDATRCPDLVELRKLHSTVATARHILISNSLTWHNQLHMEAFDLAFPRLPSEWREQYFHLFDSDRCRKSLRDLFAFITDKINYIRYGEPNKGNIERCHSFTDEDELGQCETVSLQ